MILGALAGCWAGWNLTFAVLATLALVLNINVRLFVLSAVGAAATAWAASPLTHDLGQWLLDEQRLGDFVGTYGSGPVGALLGWDVYTLVGATPIGLGIGLCGAGCAGWLAWQSSRHQGLLSWMGDDAGGDRSAFSARSLRPFGLLMALAVLPGWIAITAAVVPQLVREAVVAELTRENQAEVSVGHWEYRLWSGELRCDDVRFADPARPDFDRLRIDLVTGRLDAAAILRGRLHVRQLRLAGLATDRRRLEPAVSVAGDTATSAESWTEREGSGAELSVDDETYRDALVVDVADAYSGWGELAGYVRRYRTLSDNLVRCASYSVSSGSDSANGVWPAAGKYVALARVDGEPLRCELDCGATNTSADVIEIVGLPDSWQLGDDAVVTLRRSESDYGRGEHVVRLLLTAPECASLELATDINLRDPTAQRPMWLSLRGVSAARVAAWNVDGVQLAASQGMVDIAAEGWASREGLVMSLGVAGEQLALSVTNQPAMTPSVAKRQAETAAVDLDVLSAAVAKTRRLTFDARVEGTWQRPRLLVTPSRLLADLDYERLRTSSEQQLAQRQAATGSTGKGASTGEDMSTGKDASAGEDAGFRAPDPAVPLIADGAAVIGPAGPGGVQISRTTPPRTGAGLRVEMTRNLGVSVAPRSRIYVERPSRAVLATPARAAPLAARKRVAAAPTSPEPKASRREPLPASWLKTGYDLGTQSTPAGRRWAAQRAADRQRADKVLSHRYAPDAERR